MEQFVGSDLVLLTLTVGFYCLGSALYSRTKFALLHPVLLGFVAMILYLLVLCLVDYHPLESHHSYSLNGVLGKYKHKHLLYLK